MGSPLRCFRSKLIPSEDFVVKKLLCALIVCAICVCGLSGCGDKAPVESSAKDDADAPTVTLVPEEGDHGETDQSAALLNDLPTVVPAETLSPAELSEGASASDEYYSIDALIASADDEYIDDDADDDPVIPDEDSGDDDTAPTPAPVPVNGALNTSVYQYSALVDTSLGFTFNYPSHWKNIPGVYTVCFREDKADGSFPARVAISVKKLKHSPEGTVLTDELTSYMKMVYRQYEPDSFQTGTPNAEDTFLRRQAYSNTYLAYSGETEVKGFVIGCAVKRVLYVFHFCAAYEDYQAMENIMRYMLNSVQLVEEE